MKYFPQITRIFPALVLISLLIVAILNNFSQKKEVITLLSDPFSSEPHLKLAQYYQDKNNNFSQSEQKLYQNYLKNEYVFLDLLGIQTEDNGNLAGLTNKTELIRQQNYWQRIITQFPEYYPAYLNLAVIYYNLDKKEESRQLFEKLFNEFAVNGDVSAVYQKLFKN